MRFQHTTVKHRKVRYTVPWDRDEVCLAVFLCSISAAIDFFRGSDCDTLMETLSMSNTLPEYRYDWISTMSISLNIGMIDKYHVYIDIQFSKRK